MSRCAPKWSPRERPVTPVTPVAPPSIPKSTMLRPRYVRKPAPKFYHPYDSDSAFTGGSEDDRSPIKEEERNWAASFVDSMRDKSDPQYRPCVDDSNFEDPKDSSDDENDRAIQRLASVNDRSDDEGPDKSKMSKLPFKHNRIAIVGSYETHCLELAKSLVCDMHPDEYFVNIFRHNGKGPAVIDEPCLEGREIITIFLNACPIEVFEDGNFDRVYVLHSTPEFLDHVVSAIEGPYPKPSSTRRGEFPQDSTIERTFAHLLHAEPRDYVMLTRSWTEAKRNF